MEYVLDRPNEKSSNQKTDWSLINNTAVLILVFYGYLNDFK